MLRAECRTLNFRHGGMAAPGSRGFAGELENGPARLRRRGTGTWRQARSVHQDVAELPGIAFVDILGKQTGAAVQRRPVRVVALDRSQIGHLNFKAALVVHLVGLDDACFRVFQRPDHACKDGG